MISLSPGIPYEVTVTTGDVSGAGTDANVFIRLYGEDGKKTEEFQLRNRTDNFERAAVEKFKVSWFSGAIVNISVMPLK